MKEMDEELIKQIKITFDNFDDGQSDDGWAALREKYPEKSDKKILIWWMSGIAAAMLLVFGLILTQNKTAQPANQTQLANKQPRIEQPHSEPIIEAPKQENSIAKNQSNEEYRGQIKNKISADPSPVQTQLKPSSVVKQLNETPIIANHKPSPVEQIKKDQATLIVVTDPSNSVSSIAKNEVKNPSVSRLDSTSITVIAANPPVNPTGTDLKEKNNKKTTAEFLQEQSRLLANKKQEKTSSANKNQQNSIDIFTGTFLSYQGDNDSKINAGFGLNANLKVTKGLFLSVGAGISQNKIAYQNSLSTEMENSVADFGRTYNVLAPTIDVATTTSITDVKVNAQLVNLDLPVMLKFYPSKKQNFYIATGFNSNTYLAEKYVYDYKISDPAVNNGIKEKQEQTEESKFGRFDFANSAIFAIGINQEIGKNNVLTFEPYYKPVIGAMGEKNLKINTIGLNLKFNFMVKKN